MWLNQYFKSQSLESILVSLHISMLFCVISLCYSSQYSGRLLNGLVLRNLVRFCRLQCCISKSPQGIFLLGELSLHKVITVWNIDTWAKDSFALSFRGFLFLIFFFTQRLASILSLHRMMCQYILHYTLDYVLKTTFSITAKKTQDGKEKNKTQNKRQKTTSSLYQK